MTQLKGMLCMKTNLIFKKQITVEGSSKVVTRIVPVEVPFIDSGEGWILSGHCDELEVVEHTCIRTIEDPSSIVEEFPVKNNVMTLPEKFISDVSGTAKLVRSKGVIKIVARRGKSLYNQTTPNSICIHDVDKQEFFNQCRHYHGNIGIYQFKMSDKKPYDEWNKFIDEEYKRQQLRTINKEYDK